MMGFKGMRGVLGDSNMAKRVIKGASRHSGDSILRAIGTPSVRGLRGGRQLTAAQYRSSGIRRLAAGGAILGTNAVLGPNGSRSTARSGVRPQSTGGYA